MTLATPRANGRAIFTGTLALLLTASCTQPRLNLDPDIRGTLDEHRVGDSVLMGERVDIKPRKIELTSEADLASALRAYGIHPDGEALGLVYQINPGLDVAGIVPGARLLVPTIAGPEALARAAASGSKVWLTAAAGSKQAFVNAADDFSGALRDRGESSQETSASLVVIEKTLRLARDFVVERSRPLSTQVLEQMRDEAEVLSSILRTPGPFGARELETIRAIEVAMHSRLAAFNETRGDIASRPVVVEVAVHTVEGGSLKDLNGFRVWYVGKALFQYRDRGFARSINDLVSPTKIALPEADYVIWATKPDDGAVATDIVPVSVRKVRDGSPEVVRLVVR